MKAITKKRFLAIFAVVMISVLCFGLCACSSSKSSEPAAPAAKQFDGKSLNVYCGAGMTNPFQEIADAFTAETACTVNVTFANAAQIQTQITTTKEGDFFIAGSADELQPVSDYVASSIDLVKHIPVLVVPSDNPKSINGLADLVNADTILIGDPESTPIGKIAKKTLTQRGLWDSLSAKMTTTTTAPQIATAIANGEGDAGIVWKENASADGIKIVNTTDLDGAIKTVPAATLTCAADAELTDAFNTFLQTDTAKAIWQKYGYELV